ncbi:Superoxide dismutase [Cu-Zn] [Kappamyces sp. JEL0680]|nr:Superoxide dismutase [Cu-Zn] [Kappamyces sp. JEL0680]
MNVSHGAPTDAVRHFGDLGNFQANDKGEVHATVTDHLVTLFGQYNVSGLAVVIHANSDDLGKGNTTASLLNGNAGARVSCGNIKIQDEASSVYTSTTKQSYTTTKPSYTTTNAPAGSNGVYSGAVQTSAFSLAALAAVALCL